MDTDQEETGEHSFVPRGAIAFFIALIAIYGVMWFALYFQIMGRF